MNGYQQPMQGGAPAQKDYGSDVVVDGRIVWGDLSFKAKKNYQTKQEEIDPKTGQKIMQISFGLAVPKPNPQSTPEQSQNFTGLWNAIHVEGGKQGYQYPNSKFAWKFDDGDGVKEDGSAFPEYYRGCIVLKLTTRLPLNIFKRNADGSYVQITADQVKTGDYVRVNLSIKGHPAPNPGLYVNPAGVAFLGYGDAIVASADPKSMFGAGPFNIPQGASATPIGTNVQFPNMQHAGGGGTNAYAQPPAPHQWGPATQQPSAPAFQGQPPMQQQEPVAPNWGVVPGQFQQQAPPPQQQWGQPPMGNGAQPAMQQPMTQQYGSQQNPTMQGMQQPTNFQGGAVPNAFPGNGMPNGQQGVPSFGHPGAGGTPQFPGQGGR